MINRIIHDLFNILSVVGKQGDARDSQNQLFEKKKKSAQTRIEIIPHPLPALLTRPSGNANCVLHLDLCSEVSGVKNALEPGRPGDDHLSEATWLSGVDSLPQ